MKNKSINTIIKDITVATIKGGLSPLPFGSIFAEYIGLVQESIYNKRMENWISYVEETLQKIQRSIDDLVQDEIFCSCTQVATIGAMKSYQKEKLKLFANALYTCATNAEISGDKKLFYLSLLDRYTLSHILLLNYFSKNNHNDKRDTNSMMSIKDVNETETPLKGIAENIPEFTNDMVFVKQIIMQLFSDNLIGLIDFNVSVPKKQARSKKTTKYGDDFLAFIKDYE